MPIKNNPREKILEALKDLPESELEEVLDFVRFLQAKEESISSGVDLSSPKLAEEAPGLALGRNRLVFVLQHSIRPAQLN